MLGSPVLSEVGKTIAALPVLVPQVTISSRVFQEVPPVTCAYISFMLVFVSEGTSFNVFLSGTGLDLSL